MFLLFYDLKDAHLFMMVCLKQVNQHLQKLYLLLIIYHSLTMVLLQLPLYFLLINHIHYHLKIS